MPGNGGAETSGQAADATVDEGQRQTDARAAQLVYDGRSLDHALRGERLTEAALQAAVRKQGFGSLDQTVAVVLESDGRLTVIGPVQVGDASALPPVPFRRNED